HFQESAYGFGRCHTPEACIVVQHFCCRVVECGGLCPGERTGEGATLEFVSARLGCCCQPFPGVAAQIVGTVRADTAVIPIDWRSLAYPSFPNIAFGRGELIAPWEKVASDASCALLPLFAGRQGLCGPCGVGRGVLPCHKHHRMVKDILWRPTVLIPVLWAFVARG